MQFAPGEGKPAKRKEEGTYLLHENPASPPENTGHGLHTHRGSPTTTIQMGCFVCYCHQNRSQSLKSRWLIVYLARPAIYPGFLSGGEQHFVEVFGRLSRKDHDIEVLAPPTGASILTERRFEAKVRTVAVPAEYQLDKWSNIGLSAVYWMRICKSLPLIRRLPRDYSLICASSHFLPDVLPAMWIARRNPQAKLVVYLHHIESAPWKSSGRALHGRILSWLNTLPSLRLIKRHAHLVITVSPAVKQDLMAMGVPEQRIRVYPNGIKTEDARVAKSRGTQYDACYFGRLAPSKGIIDIVDIWVDVLKKYPQAKVAIIGGNGQGYIDQVKRKIADNKLENSIFLLGVVPDDKKYENIKAGRISISTSYEEGWGIALCETMACGLPVVAYALDAYKVFGDEAIIKVPVGDKKSFAEAIVRLLSDDLLRNTMGKKAVEVANRFSWEEIARTELNDFETLVKTD